MPVHWEPSSFEEFRRALDAGRCVVAPHKWTREWVRKRGWWLWGLSFDQGFTRRITSSEPDFWLAYNDGAFDLHRPELNDVWGRRR